MLCNWPSYHHNQGSRPYFYILNNSSFHAFPGNKNRHRVKFHCNSIFHVRNRFRWLVRPERSRNHHKGDHMILLNHLYSNRHDRLNVRGTNLKKMSCSMHYTACMFLRNRQKWYKIRRNKNLWYRNNWACSKLYKDNSRFCCRSRF